MGTNEIIKLAVSGVAAALLFVLRSFFAGKNPKDGTGKKKNKKKTLVGRMTKWQKTRCGLQNGDRTVFLRAANWMTPGRCCRSSASRGGFVGNSFKFPRPGHGAVRQI